MQRSEIEGRLDPKMALYNQRVRNAIYPKVRLKDLLVCKPQYGANEPGVARLSTADTRYIRITDIDEYGLISDEDLGATIKNIEEKYILNENDILIARSGATVGKAYIHKKKPYDCIFAGYLIRFVLNYAKVLPDYVFTWTQLNAYKEWVNAIQRPSGQPNINAEEYKSLEIPLPNIEKQKEIIAIVHSAYTQKLQKESEAQQLLDSIDTYLLNELGIKLSTEPNDLNRRKFYISYNELVGKRIDSKKYSPAVKQLYAAIRNSSYHNFPLQHYVAYSCSGEWGLDGDVDIIPDGYVKCLTLRAAEIDNQYNLKIQPENAKYRLINADKYNKIKLDLNDLIIEKSGGSDDQPVGRVAIIEENTYNTLPISFSNFLMKIRVQGINPKYLYYFLKTMYNIGITDPMQSQTNGIRNLIIKEFLEQTIIEPPLAKQQEIADHIFAIRQQAKTLQAEGKAILENAKKEVEKMIIG